MSTGKSHEAWVRERAELQERYQARANLGIKRMLAQDHRAYLDGALSATTKELLGLVASMVLRCDDCIHYHLANCVDAGYSREQLLDAFEIAQLVGGTITIPHLRRALVLLEELLPEAGDAL